MALYEWLAMSRAQITVSLAGILYIVFCVGSFAILYCRETGFENVLVLLGVVWLCDIGAYTAGHLIGGPRLVPRISPNKTWAGAVGGLLLPIIVMMAVVRFGGDTEPRVFVITCAGVTVIALAAQVGDILESAAKRHFGIKDSGWIMPGHGGILDRIDGLLLAAPVALLLASILGSLL